MKHWAWMAVLLMGVVGCQKVYYNTMEAFGHPKRQILADRVQDARQTQIKAKQQFQSALERFRSVVEVAGGPLEEKYEQIKAEYEKSRAAADTVNRRIAAVKDVAEALFAEWQDELDQYTNEQLRSLSRVKLQQTRQAYAAMIAKMDAASAKMDPVLRALYDQVLFLKHNLNAQAITAVREQLIWVEHSTEELMVEMERSIAEAEAFMQRLSEDQGTEMREDRIP